MVKNIKGFNSKNFKQYRKVKYVFGGD